MTKKYWIWSVLPHPPYSADLTQRDFYLFPSLQKALKDKIFSQDQVKTFVENFLSSKSTEFYLRGINKLLDKWREVIQDNGEYPID